MTPSVSIVMPCFNAERHLEKSVGSVRAQTYADWELVMVDDGSTDSTWRLLEKLAADDGRIRIFRQANAGAAAARNRALRESRGLFTAFLDADDTWDPSFLQSMVDALNANPGAGIAYCGWQNIGLGNGRDKPYVPPDYEADNKIESLLRSCPWPIHGALVRSQIITNAGHFDETMSSCMDFDLWLRLGTNHRLVRVPRVLAYYYHHGDGQITGNRARIALNHWRAQRKFLRANPSLRDKLGARRIAQLTSGELLYRGYSSYWARDLPAARKIFRVVMQQGYGSLKDWKYMLAALLPEAWHRKLIFSREKAKEASFDRNGGT
jgi:glycosyltransferase involved in cell wall biosynthesis